MNKHIGRFNADADNPSQEPHYGGPSGSPFKSTSLLDLLDLARYQAEPRPCCAPVRQRHSASPAGRLILPTISYQQGAPISG
jgi:hypothetical protein